MKLFTAINHKKRWHILILTGILILGFVLRFHNHTQWPRKGATFDEYAWTWLGMNIIQKGVPLSWSPHPQYKIREHYIEPGGARFWLVQPYLEHPPLFGLIAGASAILAGAKDMYSVTLPQIRVVALFLGVLSIFMVYLLAKTLYSVKIALLSALIYAVIPTVAIGSRLTQNENFFIPVYLFLLYILAKWVLPASKQPPDMHRKRLSVLHEMQYVIQKERALIASGIISGLLTLAKVPWWGAGLSGIFILCSYKQFTRAVVFFAITLLLFSCYLLWGYLWDAEVFVNLLKLQTARYDITFDGLFSLFTAPYLADRFFLDGWIYAGWFSVLMLWASFKEHKVLVLGMLGYLAVYLFAIPNEPGHGWYRYPFYPFMAISLSVVLFDNIKQQTIVSFGMFTLIGASLLQHTWQSAFGFSYGVYRLFLLVCGVSSLSAVLPGKKFEIISRIVTYGLLAVVVLFSIWTIGIYQEQ